MLKQLPPWHSAVYRARMRLMKPDNWKQMGGEPTDHRGGPEATCMMLTVARYLLDGTYLQSVAEALGFPDCDAAYRWNDAAERQHSEVLERLDAVLSGTKEPR